MIRWLIMKRSIKLLLCTLAVLLAVPLAMCAAEKLGTDSFVLAPKADAATIVDSGECGDDGDNVTWTLDNEGTLTISGMGDMCGYTVHYVNEQRITSAAWGEKKFTKVVVSDGVTSIGKYAFYGCSSLTNITIPDSVTIIGWSAFENCTGLTGITLGNSVTSIGEDAFSGCSSLTSIAIPDSVTIIESSAFSGCTGLTSITIGNGVTSIGSWAFSGCTGLTSIIMGNGVTDISGSAFKDCTGLTNITIPDSVTSIGDSAFSGCSSLTNITLGNGVASIGEWAFYECSSLTSITIPDGVTSIPSGLFYNCTNLAEIFLPDSITSIGNSDEYGSFCNTAFYNNKDNWENGVLYCGKNLIRAYYISGEYTVKDGTRVIADNAFSYCMVTKVEIPDSVVAIGYSAFYSCRELKSVNLPPHLLKIEREMFKNCEELTSITVPSGVTEIGREAFNGCLNLSEIAFPGSVKKIGENVLDDTAFFATNSNRKNGVLYCGSALIRADIDISDTCAIVDGTTAVANSAFSGCEKLTGITIPVSVTDIGSYAFNETNLENVYYEGDLNAWLKINKTDNPCEGANLYFGGQLLKNATIPYGVTNIGNAFAGCKSIESVVLSNSVTGIDDSAFRNCDSLTSITIPDSVTSIGEGAFSGCTGLTSITIPKSVTKIGVWAFYDCKNLTKVFYEADLESWLKIEGSNSIYVAIWSPCWNGSDVTELYFNGQLVTEVNIPEGVESIKAGAFAGCSSIKKLSLPKSVKDIGRGAFQECRNLEIINMPYGLKTIDHYAFYGCESLKSLILPDSVSYVGEASFSGCSSLEKLIISEKMEQISMHCFSDCVSLTEVVLPIGISLVIEQAFDNCTSLKNMYILNSYFDIYLTEHTIPKTVTLHSHPGGMVEKNAKEEGYNFVPLHMWDSGTVTKAPQIGVAGEKTFTCTVCGATRTEEIAPLVPSAPDRIEVKSSDSAKELTDGIVGATHSVTVSELLASSNASFVVDKDGNRVTNTKSLATGMKIILESGGERLEKVISVLGDVNGDGEISVSDARSALRAAVGLDTLEGAYLNAARVNGSTEVAVSDARSILRAAVALDTGKDWLANIK